MSFNMDFTYPLGLRRYYKQTGKRPIYQIKEDSFSIVLELSEYYYFFPTKIYLDVIPLNMTDYPHFKIIGKRFSDEFVYGNFILDPKRKFYSLLIPEESNFALYSCPTISILFEFDNSNDFNIKIFHDYDFYGYAFPLLNYNINNTYPGNEGFISYLVKHKESYKISLYASSFLNNYYVENVIDQNSSTFYSSMDLENQFIYISFPDYYFIPLSYSITTSDHSNCYPMSWKLSGTNDNHAFVDLHICQNIDLSIGNTYFKIPNPNVYSSFKLQNMDYNKCGKYKLILNEIDFYGYALPKKIKYRSTKQRNVYKPRNLIRKVLFFSMI